MTSNPASGWWLGVIALEGQGLVLGWPVEERWDRCAIARPLLSWLSPLCEQLRVRIGIWLSRKKCSASSESGQDLWLTLCTRAPYQELPQMADATRMGNSRYLGYLRAGWIHHPLWHLRPSVSPDPSGHCCRQPLRTNLPTNLAKTEQDRPL